MGMGGNGNSPHGNGIGISQKLGNGGWEGMGIEYMGMGGMGMLKAIPAWHISTLQQFCDRLKTVLFSRSYTRERCRHDFVIRSRGHKLIL